MDVRAYMDGDLGRMVEIWNEVVRAGNAFPQFEEMSVEEAREFFSDQSRCAVAVDEGGVVGLYILHPNNVGRCAHTANASYAVDSSARGKGVGRALVQDSLEHLAECGFRGLQFNAVVASNHGAIHLYESLGFDRVGVIPGGYVNLQGEYEDMFIFYHPAVAPLSAGGSQDAADGIA